MILYITCFIICSNQVVHIKATLPWIGLIAFIMIIVNTVIILYNWVNFKTPTQKEFEKYEKWFGSEIKVYTNEIKKLQIELLKIKIKYNENI